MELYWIVEFFFGILEFIDWFLGNERLWIILNFFVLFFGIKFNGDIINCLKGLFENGFVIFFLFNFVCI